MSYWLVAGSFLKAPSQPGEIGLSDVPGFGPVCSKEKLTRQHQLRGFLLSLLTRMTNLKKSYP